MCWEISLGQQFTLRKAFLIKHQIKTRRSHCRLYCATYLPTPLRSMSLRIYDVFYEILFWFAHDFLLFFYKNRAFRFWFKLNFSFLFKTSTFVMCPRAQNRCILVFDNLSRTLKVWAIGSMAEGQSGRWLWDQFLEGHIWVGQVWVDVNFWLTPESQLTPVIPGFY